MRDKVTVLLAIGIAALLVLPATSSAQAPAAGASRKVVLTLEPGEEILKAESVIGISLAGEDLVLLLTKGKGNSGPFAVYRDGKRLGPFPALKDAMTKAYQGRDDSRMGARDCAVFDPDSAPDDSAPTPGPGGKAGETLVFKGQTIGPHFAFLSSNVTPDGSRLYYSASDKDKAWFGCSDGRKVSFGGTPSEIKFSPDGKNAAILCQGTLSMAELQGLPKLSPEKLEAAMANLDKSYLHTIDGKKFGPFGSSFGGNDFWFPAASNDLYFTAGDQVYRNGTPVLKAESFDPCAFYPAPDGKSYAIANYEGITFSDGKKFPAPLDITVAALNGKTIFKWITLENGRDIVVYQRTM